jgi:SAM-dependent methyltransferase
MMAVSERLHTHYDTKYADSDFSSVQPTPLVKRPVDRLQAAVWLASKVNGGSYLEIGAGNGSTLLALQDKYERVVGTELSAVRAKELQLLFKDSPKVEILQNNLEDDGLPFGGEQFDTVSMIAVIEHLFDPVGALRECHRILKPGGRLIVDTPNIAKWTRRIKLLFGYFPSTASLQEGLLCYDRKTPTDLHDEGHLHYFTHRSLRRLAIERAGFRQAETLGYGKTVLGRFWPQMFSEISLILYK